MSKLLSVLSPVRKSELREKIKKKERYKTSQHGKQIVKKINARKDIEKVRAEAKLRTLTGEEKPRVNDYSGVLTREEYLKMKP